MRTWAGRRFLAPRPLSTQVRLARAAAAAVLAVVAAGLIRVMWTLPWPVDAMLAVLIGATWSAWLGSD
jgi:hypothetical protein